MPDDCKLALCTEESVGNVNDDDILAASVRLFKEAVESFEISNEIVEEIAEWKDAPVLDQLNDVGEAIREVFDDFG